MSDMHIRFTSRSFKSCFLRFIAGDVITTFGIMIEILQAVIESTFQFVCRECLHSPAEWQTENDKGNK